LEQVVAARDARIAALEAENAELRRRLGQTPRNSNMPPSSQGLDKPAPKSLRGKTGRRAGGQDGHQGREIILRDPHARECGGQDPKKEQPPAGCGNPCVPRLDARGHAWPDVDRARGGSGRVRAPPRYDCPCGAEAFRLAPNVRAHRAWSAPASPASASQPWSRPKSGSHSSRASAESRALPP